MVYFVAAILSRIAVICLRRKTAINIASREKCYPLAGTTESWGLPTTELCEQGCKTDAKKVEERKKLDMRILIKLLATVSNSGALNFL